MRYMMAGALFVLAISAQTVLAGEIREIELNDGSILSGEVQSLSKGSYTDKIGQPRDSTDRGGEDTGHPVKDGCAAEGAGSGRVAHG